MKTKICFLYVLTLLFGVSLCAISCRDDKDDPPAEVKVSLDESLLSLIQGSNKTLTVTVEPASYSSQVQWSSDDTSIATVSGGVVTGVSVGRTTVYAKAGDGSDKCDIIVTQTEVNPTSVTINESDMSVNIGHTQKLTATVVPAEASDKSVKWSSNSPTVVSVTELTGEIEALAVGQAVITVTTNDGGLTDNITVTVEWDPVDNPDDFNNFPSFVMELDNEKDAPAVRIVLLGNSICYHAYNDWLQWHHDWGMAASSKDKDYVHLLFSLIEEAVPDNRVRMGYYNASGFERGYETFDYDAIETLPEFEPHILLMQLGDNLPDDIGQASVKESFVTEYTKLINFLKADNTMVTVAIPFFGNEARKNAITPVIEATGSYTADLLTMKNADGHTTANYDPGMTLEYEIWRTNGVGAHPGDKGMSKIAATFFAQIEESGVLDQF